MSDISISGVIDSRPVSKKKVSKNKLDCTNDVIKSSSETTQRLTLISLFSGGGGLDLGLEAAGFETVFASDIDYHSCITLQNGKNNAKSNFLRLLLKKSIYCRCYSKMPVNFSVQPP